MKEYFYAGLVFEKGEEIRRFHGTVKLEGGNTDRLIKEICGRYEREHKEEVFLTAFNLI